jgi:hypothetical protein
LRNFTTSNLNTSFDAYLMLRLIVISRATIAKIAKRGEGFILEDQPLASMYAASSSVIPTRAFALESKMESNGRAGMEKSLCGNGLLQGSIPPAPARQSLNLREFTAFPRNPFRIRASLHYG